MAMKCAAAFSRPISPASCSKKWSLKIFGSSVLPDLLETMKSVSVGSMRASNEATWAGSVESST